MERQMPAIERPTTDRLIEILRQNDEAGDILCGHAADEIERLKENSLPDGFVKWLTIARGPTGRLHAHWPYADSKGCLVTRELMDEMLCNAGGKPRWIPVSERLPEDGEPVMAWNSGGWCLKPWACHVICNYTDGEWREVEERDLYPGVTHWMPLPPEPHGWEPLPAPPEVK